MKERVLHFALVTDGWTLLSTTFVGDGTFFSQYRRDECFVVAHFDEENDVQAVQVAASLYGETLPETAGQLQGVLNELMRHYRN